MLPGGGTGPQLGAQFAQLVKELRSEYAGAVTAAAARIAGALFAAPGRSILRILQQHGVTGTPSLMQQQARAAPAQATLPCPLLGRAQAAAACAGPLWGLCEGGGLVSGACVPSPGRQNSDGEFRRIEKQEEVMVILQVRHTACAQSAAPVRPYPAPRRRCAGADGRRYRRGALRPAAREQE